MKTTSLWIIRVALAVQFVGVLAVPALVAAADSPRGIWMAEWLRPHSFDSSSLARSAKGERSIGVLRLRDGKLSFDEQVGHVEWELDLATVKRVATINGGPSTSLRASGSLLVVSNTGDEYIVSIMDADLMPGSPMRVASTIERAIEFQTSDGR